MAIAAALAPFPRWREFTALGAVASGALLQTYVAGSSTPFSTWSDSALAVANSNPMVADSGGLFGPIYLAFGQSYRFVLTTSTGTLIWDQDNISTNSESTVTSTATGPQDDFVLPAGTTYLRFTNASTLAITGIAAGIDGQVLHIIAAGAGTVGFAHQSAGSAVANRLINFVTTGNTVLTGGSGALTYLYDGTTQRWRLIAYEMGASIAVVYAGTNFTASSGTWTVASGDQAAYQYYMKGRLMTLIWSIISSSVSATPVALRLAIPGGMVPNVAIAGPFHITSNAGAAAVVGTARVLVSVGYVELWPTTGTTAWAVATDTTSSQGELTFEVL
jgi:hypothetical protein